MPNRKRIWRVIRRMLSLSENARFINHDKFIILVFNFDAIMLFKEDDIPWLNLSYFVPDADYCEFLRLLIAYDESSVLLFDRLNDYSFGYWR